MAATRIDDLVWNLEPDELPDALRLLAALETGRLGVGDRSSGVAGLHRRVGRIPRGSAALDRRAEGIAIDQGACNALAFESPFGLSLKSG